MVLRMPASCPAPSCDTCQHDADACRDAPLQSWPPHWASLRCCPSSRRCASPRRAGRRGTRASRSCSRWAGAGAGPGGWAWRLIGWGKVDELRLCCAARAAGGRERVQGLRAGGSGCCSTAPPLVSCTHRRASGWGACTCVASSLPCNTASSTMPCTCAYRVHAVYQPCSCLAVISTAAWLLSQMWYDSHLILTPMQIAILMGCAVLPHLKSLVDIVKHGACLVEERVQLGFANRGVRG